MPCQEEGETVFSSLPRSLNSNNIILTDTTKLNCECDLSKHSCVAHVDLEKWNETDDGEKREPIIERRNGLRNGFCNLLSLLRLHLGKELFSLAALMALSTRSLPRPTRVCYLESKKLINRTIKKELFLQLLKVLFIWSLS